MICEICTDFLRSENETLSAGDRYALRALWDLHRDADHPQWEQDQALTSSSFRCPWCRRESNHPADLEFGYCGHCHAFTRDASAPGASGTMSAPGAEPESRPSSRDVNPPR